jgi:hypothetical protein
VTVNVGNVLIALVFVGLATTLVAHKGTSSVFAAAGNAFSTSMKASTADGRDLPDLPDLK